MIEEPEPLPVDHFKRPNIARVYDYYLGGKDWQAADEAFAERLGEVRPDVQTTVLANRAFLRRVVRYLVERGVRQFLDIGSGLPTRQNVHEVAQGLDPACRIVYVDRDPVAVAHANAFLASDQGGVGVVLADLRDPNVIFDAQVTRELIDWSRPVAVLMIAILHFVLDADRPHEIVARYVDRLSDGGFLAVSHALTVAGTEEMTELYADQAISAQARSEPEIGRFLTGLDLVPPGLVPVDAWRPIVAAVETGEADHASDVDMATWWLGGVGEKTESRSQEGAA
jgi:hypothetical protein